MEVCLYGRKNENKSPSPVVQTHQYVFSYSAYIIRSFPLPMKLKKVMFSPVCVFLSVYNQDNSKSYEYIVTKLAVNDHYQNIFL